MQGKKSRKEKENECKSKSRDENKKSLLLKGPFKEEISIQAKLPNKLFLIKNATYFVDSYFKNKIKFKDLKRVKFVKAGENLKTLKSLQSSIDFLIKANHQKNDPIVAIGGGSVGDFTGFLSSVYLRGVPFYSVPTTWLSVIDSGVGGKTALNFKNFKNQIGSFYAPKEIIISTEILKTSRVKDAQGEILKTLFLNLNKKWAKEQLKDLENIKLKNFIKYKSQVVKKDIKDSKGIRAVLNLGHTLAHAYELEFKLSHSDAVLRGLSFTLNWSKESGYLSEKKHNLLYHNISAPVLKFKSVVKLEALLKRDKKTENNFINFIFLSDKGPLVKKVKLKALLNEYQRQIREL